ncbi:hypothetical protein DPMN_182820 [Dreissena polymorpha]|uniref:Uncharacterized protein n=1 Tax=Dreissena polymorpha TaxID=45954 RepID=A0A9D4I4Y5_DREPO|nr:hypothetical protein DPMN_182820 [Dreissena polymorpha]
MGDGIFGRGYVTVLSRAARGRVWDRLSRLFRKLEAPGGVWCAGGPVLAFSAGVGA